MKHPILLFLIVLPLLLNTSCNKEEDVQLPDRIKTAAALDVALQTIYEASAAPGFAISIAKNNELLYQQAFGHADMENNVAYTNKSVQPIGSVSKTFVAAALVTAIEQGILTLETDINTILPFELINPKQPDASIQVKHLVTHTSGLLDRADAYFDAYYILPDEKIATAGARLMLDDLGFQQRVAVPIDEFLANYYTTAGSKYDQANFAASAPGTIWNYSNIATTLTAYLIEIATATPFDEYVQTNVLQPLGMYQTAYTTTNIDPTNLAKLYWEKGTWLPQYANDSYPDGSLYSSNEDLAQYLLDMMKGARGEASTLFSAAGYELLFEASEMVGKPPTSFGEQHSIFWFLPDHKIRHDGSDPGTTTLLEFDQTGETGYLLLTNMDASTDVHLQHWLELAEQVEQVVQAFLAAN
jgi:CubicO group peptidase (beta-lactamase class C family)